MVRPKLLSILSTARAGSTLLGRVLGQGEGVGYPGEVDLLWARTIALQEPCGCGALPHECPLWSAVLMRLCEDTGRTPAEVIELSVKMAELRQGFSFLDYQRAKQRLSPGLRRFVQETTALLNAYRAVTGDTVLIDSSKSLLMAAALPHFSEFDVSGVFLHRASSGVYASSHRREEQANPWQLGPRVALGWSRTAVTARQVEKRGIPLLDLHYRHLATNPAGTAAAIFRSLGVEEECPSMMVDGVIDFDASHVGAGSPAVRAFVGPTPITLNDKPSDPSDRVGPMLTKVLTLPATKITAAQAKHRRPPEA